MQKQKDGFAGERALVLPDPLVREFGQDPQLAALYIPDIGHYPCARNHYRERTTPINQYILIYCTEGRGQFSLQGRSHTVSRNQFFILPPGIPHAYGAARPAPRTIPRHPFGGPLAPPAGHGPRPPGGGGKEHPPRPPLPASGAHPPPPPRTGARAFGESICPAAALYAPPPGRRH